jgi:hypothetical protein
LAINARDIQKELVKLTGDLVGSLIYNYPSGQEAVFLSGAFNSKTPPSPKYPYIAIDSGTPVTPYQHKLKEGWIEDPDADITLGYYVQQTRVLPYTITVYGDGNIDLISISNELALRLKRSKNIEYMKEFEAFYYQITNPLRTSILVSDEYKEIVTFTVSYTVTDFVVDIEGDGIISKVEVDTEVHKDEDGRAGLYDAPDDTTPLHIQTGLIEAP